MASFLIYIMYFNRTLMFLKTSVFYILECLMSDVMMSDFFYAKCVIFFNLRKLLIARSS
jgi:hypothetical protein